MKCGSDLLSHLYYDYHIPGSALFIYLSCSYRRARPRADGNQGGGKRWNTIDNCVLIIRPPEFALTDNLNESDGIYDPD